MTEKTTTNSPKEKNAAQAKPISKKDIDKLALLLKQNLNRRKAAQKQSNICIKSN